MRPAFLYIIFIFVTMHLYAQSQIEFETTDYNFSEWKPDKIAVFPIKNTGDKNLVILKTENSTEIHAIKPNGYILPGTTDTLFISYNPRVVGEFIEEIKVHTTAATLPIVLTIRGNVTDIVDCPDFSGGNLTAKRERFILVRDKLTKEPIYNANIKTFSNNRRIGGRTNREGKLDKDFDNGNCDIEVIASGYIDKTIQAMVYPSTTSIIIELIPETVIEVEPVIPEPVNKENPDHDTSYIAERKIDTSNTPENVIDEKPDIKETDNKLLSTEKYAPNNIVFLLDVSMSMKRNDKMKHLKTSILSLVEVIRSVDKITVISFATEARVLLTAVRGDEKAKINPVIDSLEPWGMTYGVLGLKKAYDLALEYYQEGGNNQVLLATDGGFNGPDFSDRDLATMIKGNAKKDIRTSIIGFKGKEQSVELMESMAEQGKGKYILFDKNTNINSVLIEEIKTNSRIIPNPE